VMRGADRLARRAAHGLIRAYQLTLSGLIGRPMPSTSRPARPTRTRPSGGTASGRASGWGWRGSAAADPGARTGSISSRTRCRPPRPGISPGLTAAGGVCSRPRRARAARPTPTRAPRPSEIPPRRPRLPASSQE
jgi:hypothetical protein